MSFESLNGRAAALDLDLIRKRSLPSPRYTYYPPATQFTAERAVGDLEATVSENNRAGAGPISLYFHLPFCETSCWFCGCTTVITKRRDSAYKYLNDLAREMRLTAAYMDTSRPVTQIYLGGGTPIFFPLEELRRIGGFIAEIFPNCDADCEFSVEIDRRRLTLEHVLALREIGANRAFLIVQDPNPRVQIAVHRHQSHYLNERAFTWLRIHSFQSINVDLIFGIPLQTRESFSETIDYVLVLTPERLSVFSYGHVPWIKPAQEIFDDREELPDPEQKLGMFGAAHKKIAGAGFIDIGLDHFAKPGDELANAQSDVTLHRNLQGYITRGGASLISFGVSFLSSTNDSYRQNLKTLPEWRAALHAGQLPFERGLQLNEEDLRRRKIIIKLMCARCLEFDALSSLLRVNVRQRYTAEIANFADLESDGIIVCSRDAIAITALGVPLLWVVAMRFDPNITAGLKQHSRTI